MTHRPSGLRMLVRVFAALPLVLLSACSGPSVWEQTFTPAPEGSGPVLADGQPVRVRNVPWERMQATMVDLDQAAAASDVHPENWSPAQKSEAKARLLRGLQFDGATESTRVLGRCEFRTTETIQPAGANRKGLEEYARKVGATDVVWSSRILGQTEKIVERPVTTFGTTSFWGGRGSRGRWWETSRSENSTTWVPMKVPADDTGFVAYFLRRE